MISEAANIHPAPQFLDSVGFGRGFWEVGRLWEAIQRVLKALLEGSQDQEPQPSGYQF